MSNKKMGVAVASGILRLQVRVLELGAFRAPPSPPLKKLKEKPPPAIDTHKKISSLNFYSLAYNSFFVSVFF